MYTSTSIRLVGGVVALAVIFVLAAVVPSASAIKCYQCNSIYDKHCTDVKENVTASSSYLRECDDTNITGNSTYFCRKIVQRLTNQGGDTRVIRKCGFERDLKSCYHYDDFHHTEVVCQCFDDACNAAPRAALALAPTPWRTASAALLLCWFSLFLLR